STLFPYTTLFRSMRSGWPCASPGDGAGGKRYWGLRLIRRYVLAFAHHDASNMGETIRARNTLQGRAHGERTSWDFDLDHMLGFDPCQGDRGRAVRQVLRHDRLAHADAPGEPRASRLIDQHDGRVCGTGPLVRLQSRLVDVDAGRRH